MIPRQHYVEALPFCDPLSGFADSCNRHSLMDGKIPVPGGHLILLTNAASRDQDQDTVMSQDSPKLSVSLTVPFSSATNVLVLQFDQ